MLRDPVHELRYAWRNQLVRIAHPLEAFLVPWWLNLIPRTGTDILVNRGWAGEFSRPQDLKTSRPQAQDGWVGGIFNM
jgi:hypothetical protein